MSYKPGDNIVIRRDCPCGDIDCPLKIGVECLIVESVLDGAAYRASVFGYSREFLVGGSLLEEPLIDTKFIVTPEHKPENATSTCNCDWRDVYMYGCKKHA